MQWQELCEKAKEIGLEVYDYWILDTEEGLDYYYNGTIDLHFEWSERDVTICFAKDRTPDQMYQIMEALK